MSPKSNDWLPPEKREIWTEKRTQREEATERQKQRSGDGPQVKQRPGPPGAPEARNAFALGASRKSHACRHLDSGFWPARLGQYISVIHHTACSKVLWQPRRLTQNIT